MENFEYQLCPFHNVTQRRLMAQSWQLLGVWNKWKHQGGGESKGGAMMFTSDNSCAGEERSVQVNIHCLSPSAYPPASSPDNGFFIIAVDESEACRHVIEFKTPLPCVLFKDVYSSSSSISSSSPSSSSPLSSSSSSSSSPSSSSSTSMNGNEDNSFQESSSSFVSEGLPIIFPEGNTPSSHFFPIQIKPLFFSPKQPTPSSISASSSSSTT